MTNIIFIEHKKPLSFSAKTLATILTVISAVVLPQIFHWIGSVSGSGVVPGIAFSPMHLPIIIAGLIAGPWVGAIAGVLSPVVSHLLSGMPVAKQLPFMMIELFGYGLASGFLRYVRLPNIAKVLLTQVFGRVLYMLLAVVSVYAFKNTSMSIFGIWQSVPTCLPGIILQLAFIPLLIYRIENTKTK